ncbi:restriction endonuclease subunit S [Segatella copri]|uniref:restriction endonuclease subunit S n=1 Tax=Segatella copri TaxID=165179 RepID=UPI001931C932|nr:restriction endonuclease subunit S [Segatella copri]MBM0143889.1 restriction endonuclease subunit S [Segatella copri]
MDTKALRQKILDLAIHGKLVPQDPNDEPASVLLERIRAEKERLIKEGKIKKGKKSAKTSDKPHYPFELPKGWVWTTIEDVCSKIGSGSTPKGSNYSKEGIPFFRSQNVYNSGIVMSDIKYISDEIHQMMIGTEVVANDLLLNITGGSLGRCAVIPSNFEKGNVSQHVCILRPIVIKPEFLHCFILSSFFAKSMKITGSGREGLPKYNLEKMLLPLPPEQEQERIVAETKRLQSFVDELETSCENMTKLVAQVKSKVLDLAIHGKLVPQDPNDEPASELLKRINPKAEIITDNGHYQKIVPFEVPNKWKWCKLKDICTFLSRGKSPKYKDEDGTYPVFAQKCNLKDGGISLEQARFLDPDTLGRWDEKYKLRNGDVLINSTGTGTVGRTRLFTEECLDKYPFVVPDSHVSVVRTHADVVSEFVYAYISSAHIQQYIEDNLAGSTNQKELYVGVLEEMDFPLPPLKEQKRIVSKIKSIFAQLDTIVATL